MAEIAKIAEAKGFGTGDAVFLKSLPMRISSYGHWKDSEGSSECLGAAS
ncbi:MAG: hypothetical protein JOY77_11965 [Alphaproteobacteria bacterium]|nr:hypothetical protein [Alphaproteobacteria bacterium]